MTNPTLSNITHSNTDEHHTEHDTYGDKLVWFPALGVIFAGLGMYYLLDQNMVMGLIFGGIFLSILLIYFIYHGSRKPQVLLALPIFLVVGLVLALLLLSSILVFDLFLTMIFGIAIILLILAFYWFITTSKRETHIDLTADRNLQMWGFLASEVIFFTGIIGLSLLVRTRENILERFWGTPGEYLDILLTAVNTFILICSSLTMVLAQDSVKKGDYKRFKLYIFATIVIGAIFLGIQLFEYNALMTHELEANLWSILPNGEIIKVFTPNHSLYAATFFLQTGFHGFHVTIGLVALLGVFIGALMGKFTKENHNGIELMGLYWHFVDLVWIVLFAVVYLI